MPVAVRTRPAPSSALPETPASEVRASVKQLLQSSQAFMQLPLDEQRKVARNTALVADYLVAPERIPGNSIPGGVAMPPARALEGLFGDPGPQEQDYGTARQAVSEIGKVGFSADAAREGAKAAGLLMKQVNFPKFVASLIQGVFQAIVKSSIEQMQAYSVMIGDVAKSLQQFADDNVTENQSRDDMVDRFPDVFEIGQDEWGGTGEPRLKLRDGVDESAALQRVNSSVQFADGPLKSLDVSDETVEKALVIAARLQLAKQRQQLMASLVLMGINRIVVTDGRISAKIMYDFQARDSRSVRKSAAAYDMARDRFGNVQTTRKGEETYERTMDRTDTEERGKDERSRDDSYQSFAKGHAKWEDTPIMTAMSAASEASDAALQTRAQLAGNVEVNFKSDYLPLDKMATPGMIAAIQGNSTPVDPNVLPSAKNPPPAVNADAGGGTSTTPQQATA